MSFHIKINKHFLIIRLIDITDYMNNIYLIGNNVMTLGKMSPGNNVYMEEMLLKL